MRFLLGSPKHVHALVEFHWGDMIDDIAALIRSARTRSATKLIAIDGRGGSGKSRLATALRDVIPNSHIVPVDSFPATAEENPCHPLGTQTQSSCKSLLELVLRPLAKGQPARYRPRSWWMGQTLETGEEVIPAGGVVIIEGCYSLLQEFRDFYDLKIWVECSALTAIERALRRDGGENDRVVRETVYLPNEAKYVEHEPPHLIADVVVDTNVSSF